MCRLFWCCTLLLLSPWPCNSIEPVSVTKKEVAPDRSAGGFLYFVHDSNQHQSVITTLSDTFFSEESYSQPDEESELRSGYYSEYSISEYSITDYSNITYYYWLQFGLPDGAGNYLLPYFQYADDYWDLWRYYYYNALDYGYEVIVYGYYVSYFEQHTGLYEYHYDSAASIIQQQCTNCYGGDAALEIEGVAAQTVDLVTSRGNNVGAVDIPSGIANSASRPLTMDVEFVERENSFALDDRRKIGNTVMDIVITDDLGNDITELSTPITICIINEEEDSDVTCLAFYNEASREWECEDYQPKKRGTQYCGETSHLTSFALLLGGTNDSSSYDTLFVFLSVGSVCLGLALVLFAVVLIELHFLRKRKKREATIKYLRTLSESGSIAKL